jgi:hypothetical protein
MTIDFGKVLPIFTIGEPTDEAYCLPLRAIPSSPAGPQGTGGAFLCRLHPRVRNYYPEARSAGSFQEMVL